MRVYPRPMSHSVTHIAMPLAALYAPDYPLETPRLRLRPFNRGDVDAVFAYRSRADVAEYLFDQPMSHEEVTEAGDRNDPVDVMKLLVEKGADVNAVNDLGMTPMHYAVQRGVDKIIEYLAGKGARFDVKNKQGRSPADLARGRTATLVKQLSQP